MAYVKICGLNDPTHIRVAAEAGADWVGFVLFEKSPRNVLSPGSDRLEDLEILVRTAEELGIASVVLMVDPDEALFMETLERIRPVALQLHGRETQTDVHRMWLDCAGQAELWKAFPVSEPADLEALEGWSLDRLLVDAAPPQNATRPGGNGVTADWHSVQGHAFPQPWILAGGLTPQNVIEAVQQTDAPAVDVSSGVERATGLKDEDLIRAFIDAAKSV